MYAGALRHPSPRVRLQAAYALQVMKSDALPYAQALAELLADPDPEVRQRAVWAFAALGASAIPALRRARRAGGRGRGTALTALAETGGWDALETRDQALVERLIRVKIPGEVPAPMHLCGYWFAVPVADQAAVLAAFGLDAPDRSRCAWVSQHGITITTTGPGASTPGARACTSRRFLTGGR